VDVERTVTWRDAVVPAGLLALAAVELVLTQPDGWGTGIGLSAASAALLVFRRVRPLVFATLAVALLTSMPFVGPQLADVATPLLYLAVAIYSLARWLPDLRGLVGLGVILGLLLVDYVAVDTRVHNVGDVMFVLSLTLPPFAFGRVTRRLAEQGRLLAENQELVRRQAVRDERDRIARELHDVIAHSVSAMVVQTAAAQELVRRDPDRAQQVLADVADTGRRALVETGRLLHVIRDEADELGLAPAPGAREVPALVQAFRDSGLDVELDVQEPLPALPPGVDVSVYRIVQEALTNALKHGTGRTASVRLAATSSEVSVAASNPAGAGGGAGSGLGLVGMAERVALLGGRLTHGVEGGWFRLAATLPLAGGQP
jgi:signal transduction histidine kinase